MSTDEIKKNFYFFGENVKIANSVDCVNPKKIYIGNNVQIGKYSWLCVNTKGYNKKNDWNIKINDHVFLNRNVILEAFNKIEIGKYVMFGPQVYVSDNSHNYIAPNLPVALQGFVKVNNKVLVKDGAWVGAGVRIIGNVTIGAGTVIATNAVVNKNIPDHCIAAGIPAQVIKVCDYRTGEWINVKGNPEKLKEVIQSRGLFKGYNYESINRAIEQDVFCNK